MGKIKRNPPSILHPKSDFVEVVCSSIAETLFPVAVLGFSQFFEIICINCSVCSKPLSLKRWTLLDKHSEIVF